MTTLSLPNQPSMTITDVLTAPVQQELNTAFSDVNGFAWTPVLAALVGSISHNTHNPDPTSIDDIDLLSVVLPPPARILGLDPWEHWNGFVGRYDMVTFSLRKYIGLLLKGNPNVLCTLFLLPEHLQLNAPMRELVDNRSRFVSQRAFRAFNGYAHNQFERMERGTYSGYMGEKRKALYDRFGYDPKMGAHTIRLWRMAIEFASTGELQVYRTSDADDLRAIKAGQLSRAAVLDLHYQLNLQAQTAFANTDLPPEPDYAWAEAFLLSTTLDHLTHA